VARIDLPAAGPQLAFDEYARLVTRELRRDIPTVRASTKGARTYIWRHIGLIATLSDDVGTYWFRFGAENGSNTTMASLYARDRKDAFTARNFARSIAGYFEPALSISR